MEDKEVVIEVNGLYKKFSKSIRRSLAYGTIDLFKSFFGLPINQGILRRSEFWALEDINFKLHEGESLGIIGINGSGKSTLLRLLTGIFPPDRGNITVKGEIGALIAVGAGFHPHMSGRENIYLNGTILGMTREEIDRKFNDIIEFADIGDFLDAPVSTYSSGMRVRLGFSIAVHRDPEILLIDEILSVGDISFRNKSLRYMSQLRSKSKALIFISHDIEQVRLLCDRVILMDKGKIIYDGDSQGGIVKYQELARDIRLKEVKTEADDPLLQMARKAEGDNEVLKILDLGIEDTEGNKVKGIKMSDPLNIYCEFEVKEPISSLSFYVTINPDSSDNFAISVVSSDNQKAAFTDIQPGKYKVETKIPEHHLTPGVYNPNIAFRNDKTFETYQKFYSTITFKIIPDKLELERRGVIAVEENWELNKIK